MLAPLLRAVSTLASFALIATAAALLSSADYVASQVIIAAVGLCVIVSDLGLTLFTTRTLIQADGPNVARILSTRAVLGAAAVALGAALLGLGGTDVVAFLALLPYVLMTIVRSHVFAQTRAVIGTRFELVAGPLANAVDSVVGALGIAAFRSATGGFATMSVGAVAGSVLVFAAARRVAPRCSIRVGRPTMVVLMAIREGSATVALGAAPKALAVMAGSIDGTIGTEALRWALTCIRLLDAAFSLLTTLLVIPAHADAARGELRRQPLRMDVAVGGALFGGLIVLTGLIVRHSPSVYEVYLSGLTAVLGVIWLRVSRLLHLRHGAGTHGPKLSVAATLYCFVFARYLPGQVGVDRLLIAASVSAVFSYAVARRRYAV